MFKVECYLHAKNKKGERDKAYPVLKKEILYLESFEKAIAAKKFHEDQGFNVKIYKAEGWFYIG